MVQAQTITISENVQASEKKTITPDKKWFETISLRGYMQVRYNRLLETNPDLGCEQCDRSWGNNNGLFIRRGRLVFSGNVHDRIYIYIQPDFASSASTTSNNFLQIKLLKITFAICWSQFFDTENQKSNIKYLIINCLVVC